MGAFYRRRRGTLHSDILLLAQSSREVVRRSSLLHGLARSQRTPRHSHSARRLRVGFRGTSAAQATTLLSRLQLQTPCEAQNLGETELAPICQTLGVLE